jgi:hypothetical protein
MTKQAAVEFIGVFPLDAIPAKLKSSTCVIINSDPSHLPGEHWLAVTVDKDGHCCFFDSFAKPAAFYGKRFEKLLSGTDKDYWRSKVTVQQATSNVCGFHVVYFTAQWLRSIDCNRIMDSYHSSPKVNDQMVVDYLLTRVDLEHCNTRNIHVHNPKP